MTANNGLACVNMDVIRKKKNPELPVDPRIEDLAGRINSLAALVMAQNATLEKMAALLAEQRVTRLQERNIKRAIDARAQALVQRESLAGYYRTDGSGYWDPKIRMAAAIRKTLRELTGATAAGDIPARLYESAMAHINEWDYPGAIRRIRREMGA